MLPASAGSLELPPTAGHGTRKARAEGPPAENKTKNSGEGDGALGSFERATVAAVASPQKPFAQKIPYELFCPITQSIMRDPVSTADGHTYDRREIEAWLARDGDATSPATGLPLPHKGLVPNRIQDSGLLGAGGKDAGGDVAISGEEEDNSDDDGEDDQG